MENPFTNDWGHLLSKEWEKPYFKKLTDFLRKEYEAATVFPVKEDIFNALHYTSYQDTKAVIIGQDPYHGQGQAHGLSFSVKPGVRIPPSLRNIFKELNEDIGCDVPNNGYLVQWAKEGVLMLNTVLTVREGQAYSHRRQGWEIFTDEIISLLNKREEPMVFLLWGRPAQEKIKMIDTEKHRIIQSPHPSPFAARKGFFGSKPFSRTNAFLREMGQAPIDWRIQDVERTRSTARLD